MQDPSVMPEKIVALLEANGASDITVSGYEPMTGGYSRLMARFEASFSIDGNQESGSYVLRGDPPEGQAIIETNRSQEFAVIQAVSPFLNTPAARFLDADGGIIGTPALIIDFTEAESTLPWIEKNGASSLPLKLAELSGAMHTIPVEKLPDVLSKPVSGDPLTDQILMWKQTAINHAEHLPIFRYVAAWLDANRPPSVPVSLVHHDFSTANMMVDGNGDLVVIDFELATIGDPREDLGYFKAYAQAAPPDLIDENPEIFLNRYREVTGFTEEQVNPVVMTYFLVLGVIGVVSQISNSGSAMARGETSSTGIAFNLDNLLFGQAAWMTATEALEKVLDGEVK
ncbi:MAG: phosphotransferase family protein [Actinomycetota bacterium]